MLTLKLRWKFCTLTFLYGAVLRWHHNKRPSLAVISSTEMSWMANLKMIVQIIPRVILRFPSTISSAPIDTSLTPFDAMKSRALLTLAICLRKTTHRSCTLCHWRWRLYLVESHFTAVWLWEGLSRNDFKQEHEFESIAEVVFNTLDCCSSFAQMTVTPGSEGLEGKIDRSWSTSSAFEITINRMEYFRARLISIYRT